MKRRKQAELVLSEPYNEGERQYELRVVREHGKLWGEWTCLSCGGQGKSSAEDDTQDLALWSAKMNLGGHKLHCTAPRP